MYIQMRSTHSLLVGFALLTILLAVFGRTQASVATGVVVNEVLYNPSGTDTGFEWVELYNATCEPVDLTNYEITAASGSFYVFPIFILNPHSYVVVHWRQDGSNTVTDLYTGSVGFSINMGNTTGYVALFNGTAHTQTTIVDYVAYGAGGQSWESTAVGANIWQSGSYVENASEGSSIGLLVDGQDNNSPSNWSVSPVPTGGVGNDNVPEDACVTATPTFDPTPTPTLTPTATPLPSPTQQPSPSVTATPSPTLTPSPIPTVTQVPTVTPTPTTIPVPSPTYTPTPTAILTPTITQAPTPIDSTTPTPVESPTPTVVPVPTVRGMIPTVVEMGSSYDMSITIEAASPGDGYYIKFEASVDGREWYEGKTLGYDGLNYLAWNSSWSRYPRLQISSIGLGSVTISAMVKSDSTPGPVSTRIKVSRISDGKVFYSPIYTTLATKTQPLSPTPTLKPIPLVTPTLPVSNVRVVTNIREARSLSIGTKAELKGVVIAPVGLLGNDAFYIGDETGGIKVWIDEVGPDLVKIGDVIKLVGLVESAYGELYIKVENPTILAVVGSKQSYGVKNGRSCSIGETNEGELVTVSGRVAKTSGSVFFVDDGSGGVKVYIKDSTEIDKPYMRIGYYVQVRGIVSQYNDEYRLMPRYQSDLIVSKTPIKSGFVLGAFDEVSVLPATGSNWVLVNLLIIIGGAILWVFSWFLARGGTMLSRE